MGTRSVTPAHKAAKAYLWRRPWRWVVVDPPLAVREEGGPFDTATAAIAALQAAHPDAWLVSGPDSQPKEIPEPCTSQTEPF